MLSLPNEEKKSFKAYFLTFLRELTSQIANLHCNPAYLILFKLWNDYRNDIRKLVLQSVFGLSTYSKLRYGTRYSIYYYVTTDTLPAEARPSSGPQSDEWAVALFILPCHAMWKHCLCQNRVPDQTNSQDTRHLV